MSISDPTFQGYLGSLSFLVTLAGFWLALSQIKKAKRAADAAAQAATEASRTIRSRENLVELSNALGFVAGAKIYIEKKNFDAANVHIDLLRNALVQLGETLTHDKSTMQSAISKASSVSDQIVYAQNSRDEYFDHTQVIISLGKISETINNCIGKIRSLEEGVNARR